MDDDIIFQILSQKEENTETKYDDKILEEILGEKTENEVLVPKKEEMKIDSINKSDEKNEEKYFIPNIQNPIDFVNYIEIEQSNTKISQAYSNFIIKNHRKKTKLKSVLDIEPHLDINKTIFNKENEKILSIYLKDDDLILCNSIGTLIFFSLKEKKISRTLLYPEKFFSLKEVKDSDKIINCLDITDEHDYLFVGYNSGNINIYDLKKNTCKYSANKIHTNTPCIELKYSHKEKNNYHVLSCDIKGNVSYNIFRDGTLGWRLISSDKLIENKAIPIFILKFVRPRDFCNNIPTIKDLHQTAIFGAIDSIYIYTLEPKINEIDNIAKPEYVTENYVPDIQIGVGKSLINYKMTKIDNTNKLIMAICWGKIITFYDLPIKNGFIIMPFILGNYINDSPIIKSGFLGNSILYFIDENFILKIINTRKANFGNIQLIPLSKRVKVPKTNSDAELLRETLLERNVLYQQKISDPEDANIKKNVYHYTIIEDNSSLYILCKNSLYYGTLVDWKEFLSKLSQKDDYLSMFSIGIDIYQGKMNALLNIPQEEESRKKLVGDFLRGEISRYVIFSTGSKKTGTFDTSEDKQIIKDCMNLSIDLCLEIDSFDFLIKTLEPMFEAIGYESFFLNTLEPFILYDRIKDVILNEDIIKDIINLYVEKNMKEVLSQLLLHLDIKCLEKEQIIKRIKELNLNSVLIYLYMSGKNEDYFEPIKLMYEYFTSSDDIPNFNNYNEAVENNPMSKVLKSKQYYGHKILWYIKLCLTGRKFPNNEEKMNQELFNKLIPNITYWLITEKVLNSFISFDCKDYFSILQNIFSLEIYRKMLVNTAKDENMKIQISAMLLNEKYQLTDIEPLTLIEYIIKLCNDKDENVKLYSYIFIINSSKINDINKKLRSDSINFVLNKYGTIIKEQNNEEISVLTKQIIEILSDEYMFKEYELESYYEKISSEIFDEVSLFILNRLKKYHKCLELFIKPKSNINNRIQRLFQWVSDVYKSLEYNEKGMNDFKKDIRNKLCEIAEININKFDEMVKEMFEGQRKMVLEKLFNKNKKLCLNYIELLLSKFRKIVEREQEIDFHNQDFISYFLVLHIKLLCEFNKFDEVLKAIENKDVIYPFKETLEICKENNLYDSIIYLYEINGECLNGVEQCLERLQTNFKEFINDIENNKELNEQKINEKYISINRKYLNRGMQVCENNSLSIEDEVWFKLLNKLYEFDMKLKEQLEKYKDNNQIINLIEYFHNQIIQDIKDTMEKLCSFVGITKILNIVSEQNKNAGLKEFKDLLMKILFNYGRQTKIFESIKKLLENLIFQNEKNFHILNQEAGIIDSQKCDKCQKNFNYKSNNDSLVIFKCQHLLHYNCTKKEKGDKGIDLFCPLCSESDIEQSISTKNSLINRKSLKFYDGISVKKDSKMNASVNKQKMMKKLKIFDSKIKNKKKLIIESNLQENY